MIVYIKCHCYPEHWDMKFDLEKICQIVGKREYDSYQRKYYVDYPVNKFRKLLKLIVQYGDEQTVDEVQEYLNAYYPKWGTEFEKILKKGR